MTGRLTLGYREAGATATIPVGPRATQPSAATSSTTRTVQPPAGETPRGSSGTETAPRRATSRGAVHASYLHTHWARRPEVAQRLVAIAASAREVPA